MPPISRIRLSPTTVTPSAAICCPIPVKFDTAKNALLTNVPTMIAATMTGSSAASRSQEMAAAWRLRPAMIAAMPGSLTICSEALLIERDPFGRGYQRLVVERGIGELGKHLAADQHDHPVADRQVGQLVGGEEQPGTAFRRDLGQLGEQQRLRRHVHAPGRRDRHDQLRLAYDRPRDRDLLLVTAGQLTDRLPGADG